jgi:futalosine hydrolase
MRLLVCAATGLELAAALGLPQLKTGLGQGEERELEIFGRGLRLLVTGLGVVNAALHLGRALGRGDISGVVNLGVAGSFDPAAHPLGAVRLVTEETWPEYGLLPSGAVAADARGLGFALGGGGAAAIFERLEWDAATELAQMGLQSSGWHTATSLTVSGVTADTARAARLKERFGAGLENMEGFALAYGARLAGLPFAELRAVSNTVGSRPPEAWDLPGALAVLGQAAQRLLAAPGQA